MKKLLNVFLSCLLAFAPVAFAKPVAKTEGPQGYLVLFDDACPIQPDNKEIALLRAYDKNHNVVFEGCWLEIQPGVLMLVKLPDGETGVYPRDAFNWEVTS